jgi:hypothetical protein
MDGERAASRRQEEHLFNLSGVASADAAFHLYHRRRKGEGWRPINRYQDYRYHFTIQELLDPEHTPYLNHDQLIARGP